MIEGTFRLHPGIELVVYDQLGVADQRRFEGLTRDPTFYGVLITPSTAKAVDRDSALLLLTLRTPGAIPRYAVRALGDRARRTIAGWVLDGILEVERDGSFVSGATAAAPLALLNGEVPAEGVIGRLSIEAIQWAASLPVHDPIVIAGRLYRYNQVPLSPRYARRYETETDDDRLGLLEPRAASTLARSWTRLPASGPWVSWVNRQAPDKPVDEGMCKLYVSPTAAMVREVFPTVVTVVTPHHPLAMKVGRGLYGLLRPDKMVVYFAGRDALHGAALVLAEALTGIPAHGTPFTSSVTADGLLSWGVDPPEADGMISRLRSESWRERLANQMGAALVGAPRDNAVRHVLARLEAHGVDVRTWRPAS